MNKKNTKDILTDAQKDALLADGGNCEECCGRIGGAAIPVKGKKLCKFCARNAIEDQKAIEDLTVGCMWDMHSCSSSDCEVYEACGQPAVETDGTTSNDVFCPEHLLPARIAYYERERDRVVAESKSAAKKRERGRSTTAS